MIRLATIAFFTAVLCSCDSNSLLVWEDPDEGIRFEVYRDPSGWKTNNYLRVGENERLIDDDATFAQVRFLKIEDWLLVMDGVEVMAGYHYETTDIVGEGQWDQLPFTVYQSGGIIVAESEILGSSTRPNNWPAIIQKDSQEEDHEE